MIKILSKIFKLMMIKILSKIFNRKRKQPDLTTAIDQLMDASEHFSEAIDYLCQVRDLQSPELQNKLQHEPNPFKSIPPITALELSEDTKLYCIKTVYTMSSFIDEIKAIRDRRRRHGK